MKKLVLVLLLAPLYQFGLAQVILEGKFDLANPNRQSWDGRYLVYTFYRDVHIYDTNTGILHKETGQSLPNMSFKEGLYFRERDGHYQLRRVGETDPVLPNEFLRITKWFGNSVLAWEQTAPNLEGMKATWYDLEKGVIAQYSLAQLYQAVGYDGTYSNDAMTIFQSKPWESFIYFFHDGLITLRHPLTQKFSYFDRNLKPAFAGEFRNADPFFEGLAAVQNDNGLWGFIDKTGQEVIPFIYTKKPWPFHSGLARVENKEGSVGFIDKKGELVIPTRYELASNFDKGVSMAKKIGFPTSYVHLDSLGNETPFPCDCGMDFRQYLKQDYGDYFPLNPVKDWVEGDHLIVSNRNKSSIYSGNLEQVLPFDFAFITNVRNDKALAIKWTKFGDERNLQFFLVDLESKTPSIELRPKEF